MAIIKIRNAAIDLDAAEIPNLPASKITSGTLDNARISLDAAEIPNLDTAKITSGTLADARIPANALNSNVSVPNQSAFKNIVINGDMSLAQRATSKTGITTSTYNTIDRLFTGASSAGTWTQSQSTDVPTGQGFATSAKMDCTTANTSLGSSARLQITQKVEGQNLQYLKKGTSSAESTTLSFWVKSNKTGTYICELLDADNSNRHINKSYTISSANTWEKKTITYPGDTFGAFDNDNGDSLSLNFWLVAGSLWQSGTLQTSWGNNTSANRAVGQVNLADSTSNEWYVTGVQLEAGTSASDFEFLPVDVNLQRCQRYYYREQGDGSDQRAVSNGMADTTSRYRGIVVFPTTMRTNVSVTEVGLETLRPGAVNNEVSLDATIDASTNAVMLQLGTDTGTPYTAGNALTLRITNSTSSFVAFDGEL